MNKRNYYEVVTKRLKETYSDVIETNNQIKYKKEVLRDNYKDYTEEKRRSIQNEIMHLEEKLARLSNKTILELDRYTEELKEELSGSHSLHADELTDDIKLLNCGIKLDFTDLEAIANRSKGNTTMLKLVGKYAKDNGYKPEEVNALNQRIYHDEANELNHIDRNKEVYRRALDRTYTKNLSEKNPIPSFYTSMFEKPSSGSKNFYTEYAEAEGEYDPYSLWKNPNSSNE